MSSEFDSKTRRSFLKGMAIGTGGYVLGSFLTHPSERRGNPSKIFWKKSLWKIGGVMLPVD